jgi:hypothetical protein
VNDVNKNEIETNKKIIMNLKKELGKVKNNEVNYFVFYYNKSNKVNAYKTIINEAIGEEIKKRFSVSIARLESEQLYNYNDSDSLNNENPELINLKDVPFSNEIFRALNNTEDTFSPEELKSASSLKFAIKLGNITGFDVLRKISFMKHKKRYMWLNDSGTFEEVGEQVFLEIPDSFSAIYYDDYIIVLKETVFDSIFNYHDKIMKIIRDKNEYNENLFSDIGNFYDSVEGDSKKARKLYGSYNSSYIKTLNVSDIKNYAEEFNLEIYFNPQDNKIDFDKSNAWHVVKAISEDFYTGRWSKRHFESNTKRQI